MNYRHILEEVPEYTGFLTVDELDASSQKFASDHPDKVTLTVIDNSRKGNPIQCLKIGTGHRRLLAFACPIPMSQLAPRLWSIYQISWLRMSSF